MHINIGALGGRKGVLETMELDLQAVVKCPAWVLGTELSSTARAVDSLNC